MTGLPNRRVLLAVLDALDETAGPVALLLIDIDHFQKINDRLGHDIGDHVLREVATRLARIDNEVLVVCLGDEFAAVVPGPVARALQFAEAIDRCRATNNLGARRFVLGGRVDRSGAHFCCAASLALA